jgi:probable F420-dependent oxidoreductase
MDRLGVDSIWNSDHFFPPYGDPGGPHFEGWTSLALLAPQTRSPQVGCLVLAMSYRNPALLSAMATTLDHATAGRLVLGVGAGWFARDYHEYGYAFGTASARLQNLERGLRIIKARWSQDHPPPVRGRIPVLIGGGGERVTLRITAEHADLWNGFGPPEQWARKNQILDDWCRKIGRDPATIERTAALPADAIDSADAFREAGATHLIVELGTPYDTVAVERLLNWRDHRQA